MDMLNMTAWEGRTQIDQGLLTPQSAAQIAVALGGDHEDSPTKGDPLPPLWHWCAFPSFAKTQELGEDGHPRSGDLVPPLGLPRRMWAGGELSFYAPLIIGERLQRQTTVLRIKEKGNATAPMVFVTLQHDISGAQGLAIRERQTLVYRTIPDRFVPPKPRAMPSNPVLQTNIDVDEKTLFRFSAVTCNAHRIHYDLPYTQTVERYPSLVIHGPFQAMQLMRCAIQHRGRIPSLFEFRSVHPMFLHAGPMTCAAQDNTDGSVSLFTGQQNHQGTVANAVWEETI